MTGLTSGLIEESDSGAVTTTNSGVPPGVEKGSGSGSGDGDLAMKNGGVVEMICLMTISSLSVELWSWSRRHCQFKGRERTMPGMNVGNSSDWIRKSATVHSPLRKDGRRVGVT